MHSLTDLQQQKISAFLFAGGHANPRFVGKHVIYRDQTRGQTAMDMMVEYQVILELVEDLSLDAIEKLVTKAALHQTRSEYDIPDLEKWSNSLATLITLAKEPYVLEVFTKTV